MKKRIDSWKNKSSSQALVVVLLAVTLLSIIIIAFLLSASLHHSVSRQDYQSQVARSMAVTGMNSAITQIRTALGPWDDPFNNFCGGSTTSAPPAFYWSVSPGIISRWSYTSVTPQTNYPLFSQSAYGDTNLANLNVPTSDGIYPIIGGANPPAVQVYWANVLQNPSLVPSSTNQIVGRYAFWVDDESAKINLNTADGTLKYQTNSLGIGTPSEVSLQVLQSGGTNITTAMTTNIVYIARTTGFNSVPDILRAMKGGTNFDLYTNNVFNLTTCSRGPDLNVFGQPKMALLPMLVDSGEGCLNIPSDLANNTNLLNGITLQPLKEIYPTPSQLPSYPITNVVYSNYWGTIPNASVPWPMAFQQEFGVANMGMATPGIGTYMAFNGNLTKNYYCWMNGLMLAKYLAGTNAMGQPVTWPVFPGSSGAGFAGKYTSRQIDSVVAQTISLGAKMISPDYVWSSASWAQGPTDYMTEFRGRSAMTTPVLFPGWLTGKWVNGVGRAPVAAGLMMEFQTFGSIGDVPSNSANYTPPETVLNTWLECWLPAAYLGGNNVIPLSSTTSDPIVIGNTPSYISALNEIDMGDAYPTSPAPLPKATSAGSTTGLNSYWGNQLLTNNQGIDFMENTSSLADPDTGLATLYHTPWADNGAEYVGAGYPGGGWCFSPLNMGVLQTGANMWGIPAPSVDWAPGEIRTVSQYFDGSDIPLKMTSTANGGTLQIGGGINLSIQMDPGTTGGQDADDVPLESIRGSGNGNATTDGESWSGPAVVGSPQFGTVRDRAVASVIPISFTMQIPPSGDGSDLGNTEYVWAQPADPLVNKFPGDWTMTTNSVPSTTMQLPTPIPSFFSSYKWFANYSSYSEYDTANSAGYSFHTQLAAATNGIQGDPDSYWLPQADCSFSYLSDLASQTIIPRSARFPNIGYFQYMRTGIIPDDESQPYQAQHGTPFRLLSYAPSTESTSQETTLASSQPYPDWAMLDLLYVPSLLAPYAGPYGYYDPNNNNQWTGYGNPGVLANYSTFGGSTPGRINPNGAVIYTTNSTIPQPGVSRTLPMQAILQGLMINQQLVQTTLAQSQGSGHANPGFTGGTSVDAPTIAQAVANYISANGPLRMPAEICNVPGIANERPGVNATRNDLVRQILGALTTQSNVFSVWTVGQTVMKNPANNVNYGRFEPGDTVLAETRLHYIVERYLDPGADGVYGNTSSAGTDGIVGTYDDPVDPVKHPYCPRYLYRVIAAEEVR